MIEPPGAAALQANLEGANEGWFPDGCEKAIYRILAKASARIALAG